MISNSFNPTAEVPDLSDVYSLTEYVWNFFKCFHLHSMTRYALNYVEGMKCISPQLGVETPLACFEQWWDSKLAYECPIYAMG